MQPYHQRRGSSTGVFLQIFKNTYFREKPQGDCFCICIYIHGITQKSWQDSILKELGKM